MGFSPPSFPRILALVVGMPDTHDVAEVIPISYLVTNYGSTLVPEIYPGPASGEMMILS